jgi:hypothetical protein
MYIFVLVDVLLPIRQNLQSILPDLQLLQLRPVSIDQFFSACCGKLVIAAEGTKKSLSLHRALDRSWLKKGMHE